MFIRRHHPRQIYFGAVWKFKIGGNVENSFVTKKLLSNKTAPLVDGVSPPAANVKVTKHQNEISHNQFTEIHTFPSC